jgi:hypothetical protein
MTRAVAGGCVLLALLDGYHHQFITFKEKGAPVNFVVPETMIKEPSGIWITKNTTRVLMRQLCLSIFFFQSPGKRFTRAATG